MKKLLLFFTVISVNSAMNAQWTSQATGFTPASRGAFNIRIVDANTVWALGFDGAGNGDIVQEFTRTIDGGSNWTAGTIDVGNTAYHITNISPVSGTTAWVGAIDSDNATIWAGGVWKTKDSGLTWVNQNATAYNNADSYFDAVHFFDANTGITFGDPLSGKFEIYKTTDGGDSWNAITSVVAASGEYGYNGGVIAAGNSVWFTTNKGKLVRTTDQGATWTKLNGPSGFTDFGGATINGTAYFSDDNNGLILGTLDGGSTYKLYNTTNGGTSWSAGVAYTGGSNLVLSYVPGTTTIVATSSNGTAPSVAGSAYSNDNGVTWTAIDTGAQRGDVSFLNGTTGWCGGYTVDNTTDGIFKYSGPALATNSVTVKSKFTVSPNPTTGMIKLASGSETINEVGVFDLLGKQVYSSKFSALNEVNLDLTSLQTGSYLLKVSSNTGNTESIKIMKN
jgi:photosystem II stability/assembly factor-like uncharacterized protein